MHPDAARFWLSGRLDGCDVELSSISSPTHPTAVRPGDTSLEILLPIDAAVPDRDFVLRWRRASRPDLQSMAWISSDREETYALIQLRAPDDVPTDREGSDLYFLVDRSGSMAGEKWAKTADALNAFVKAITQHDRVWITFFESNYRDFRGKAPRVRRLAAATEFPIPCRTQNWWGAELLPALRHVPGIQQRYSASRRSHIILITDGQVANEEGLEALRWPAANVGDRSGADGQPKLLLLDEPSLGLAPLIVQQVFQIIAEIRAQGTTVLLVEQNAHMALSIGDRGYVLETGRLVAEGNPEALWNNDELRAAYLVGRKMVR
jgi:hypothetical protein